MTVKEIKIYLEKNGFTYTGDAKFLKDVKNAEALEDEIKLLTGSLTFTKTYESETEDGSFVSKIEYYVTRNAVIMSFINSVGQKKKAYRASLRDLKIGIDGRFEGFEQYQYTKGIK